MRREAYRFAPRDLDPLSWLPGSRLMLIFCAFTVAYSVGAITVGWQTVATPWLQVAALVMVSAAYVLVYRSVLPKQGTLTLPRALLAMVLGWLGVTVSAVGYAASPLQFGYWWASFGLATIILSLAPYLSAARILVVGIASCVVTGGAAVALAPTLDAVAPPATTVLIGMLPTVAASTGAVVFSYQVAKRILSWAENTVQAPLTSGIVSETAMLAALRGELATVGASVAPLLQRVVRTGVVTDADRAEAAQRAEHLRSELVERSNRSWLDTVASGRAMTVVDPDRRAERMTVYQRSMLQGLLLAALDDPRLESPRLVIELRGDGDGATAVAITMDVQLPEGRRVTLLAPHYLTLSAAAYDLSWSSGDLVRMQFRLPAD